jgi:cathepsin F
MKLFLLSVLLASLALLSTATTCTREEFAAFKTQYHKTYPNEAEETLRFQIFCFNKQRAERENRAVETQQGGAVFGITKFSDMTPAEFRSRFLGYRPRSHPADSGRPVREIPALDDPPQTFDWRNHSDVLTPVYNQEQCGSCWAFSAVENIESQWALAGHNLTRLSMQQVVDCDQQDGGCNGGDTTTAYEYIISAGGLESFDDYPYTGQNGQCRFDPNKVVAKISNWEWTGRNDESSMVNYLVNTGPLSICVDASRWDSYKSGVMKSSQCGTALDHCVLAVGYNLDQGYWIVRNSWGTDWGVEHGFIYLEYGKDTCGLSREPTSSIV